MNQCMGAFLEYKYLGNYHVTRAEITPKLNLLLTSMCTSTWESGFPLELSLHLFSASSSWSITIKLFSHLESSCRKITTPYNFSPSLSFSLLSIFLALRENRTWEMDGRDKESFSSPQTCLYPSLNIHSKE